MKRRALLGAIALSAGALAADARLSGHAVVPADAPAELRIATGPPGGVYRLLGNALAEVLRPRLPGTRISTIETGASVDNMRLLAQSGTDLAIASLDAAVAGLAEGVPRDMTAVTRVYDSWLQLFVTVDSPITSLPDLDGRTVAAGAAGSGTRFTVERLLGLAGPRPKLVDADQSQGAQMLAAGQVDAYITLTGIPTPAVLEYLLPRAHVRMIELGSYVDAMNARYLGELYTPATMPSSTYAGLPAVATLTLANLLLAQPQLSDDLVELVAATLFAERARIGRQFPWANRINPRSGIATSPIRLHPGAVRYFRSVKV
jgi:TRAP transporter TAXI family solute receptor